MHDQNGDFSCCWPWALAAVVSFLATPMVKTLGASKVGAIDVPKDNRRMHKMPIPRLGGLAIFLGVPVCRRSCLPRSTGRCRAFCSAR